MGEEQASWFLTIRTVEREYSFCCMSKEKAMEKLVEEVGRRHGDVIEAELRHPSGTVETLPLV